MHFVKYLWASPNSFIGLAIYVALLPFGAQSTIVAGVVEVRGRVVGRILRSVPRGGCTLALTLGHVVLAETEADHARSRRHERVHVAQYAAWGPFFLPAYAASSLWQWMRGRDAYRDNWFEKEAYGRT